MELIGCKCIPPVSLMHGSGQKLSKTMLNACSRVPLQIVPGGLNLSDSLVRQGVESLASAALGQSLYSSLPDVLALEDGSYCQACVEVCGMETGI